MVSVQALAQESNTQKTRPQKGRKVSFQIRENPSAARHKQKAIWQPLTGQAFSFFSPPVAMETAVVCPPSRGRWARRACGAPRGKAFAKQKKRRRSAAFRGRRGREPRGGRQGSRTETYGHACQRSGTVGGRELLHLPADSLGDHKKVLPPRVPAVPVLPGQLISLPRLIHFSD